MTPQNYANHRRNVPMYHVVLAGLTMLVFLGSLLDLYKSLGNYQRMYSAALVLGVDVCLGLLFYFCRVFPLKAQDRAIRAEENLRHYVLTGKLLDPRLNMRQIIGLRFASDAEFPGLARRAAEEDLSEDSIKRSVKDWRADTYRV